MNVLVIGSGGREHALAWKLAQSGKVRTVFVAPGNDGMKDIAETVPIDVMDFEALAHFAEEKKIDLTVVGPEVPLDAGIVDYFRDRELLVFGPTAAAAKIESSKIFAKELMQKYNIPTAAFRVCKSFSEAVDFLQSQPDKAWVVKADGLAAGKGVVICENREQAVLAAQSFMRDQKFGEAGGKIVIEEFMEGEEASIFALTDGQRFITLSPAQDHKQVNDNDEGPNTGGMGAYAPAPLVTDRLMEYIKEKIIAPTIQAMKKEEIPFTGCLYAGLMITPDGPKVVEFNCRFGDPETQVVLPLLDDDLFDILYEIASLHLTRESVKLKKQSAVTVVLASGGYPEAYEKGKVISGLNNPELKKNTIVFHAGTKRVDRGFVTNGGRVLSIVSIQDSLASAIVEVYRYVKLITFEGIHFRTDIGQKGLSREKAT